MRSKKKKKKKKERETKDLYDPKIHVGESKLGGKEAGRWHKGHHLLNRVTNLFLHLVPWSPCRASGIHNVTWWEPSHNGDVLCDLRAEGWWLGVSSTDDPGTLNRKESGLETPLMGPCSEKGKENLHQGLAEDLLTNMRSWPGDSKGSGMGTVQPDGQCDNDHHLSQLRNTQRGV